MKRERVFWILDWMLEMCVRRSERVEWEREFLLARLLRVMVEAWVLGS